MESGIIRMMTGRMVDVFNVLPGDIVPINFIHSLSCINRYTGSTPFPISVMRHTITMTEYIRGTYGSNTGLALMRAAFLHDWEEALFNDLATPVKKQMPEYRVHADRARDTIFGTLAVSTEDLPTVKVIDKRVYLDEVHSTWGFYPEHDLDREGLDPLSVKFTERTWREDRKDGIAMFKMLFPETYLGAVIL